MKKIFERLILLIFNFRKLLILLWLLLIIISLLYLKVNNEINLETDLRGALNTEAHKVENILRKDFHYNPESTAAIVIEGKGNTDSLKEIIPKNFPQIRTFTEIKGNTTHNKRLYFIQFKNISDPIDAQKNIKGIRELLVKWQKENGMKTYVTGHSAFFYDMKVQGTQDTSRNERFALILALIILIFNFGGILSAFLPIFMGASTLIFQTALVRFAGMEVNPISQVLNSMIGLGLAIDYSLFIVSRFKEELTKEKESIAALITTLKNSGSTILFSALIMLCSISALLIPDVSSSRAVVKSIILVIIISCINALLFLPSMLVLGKNILNRPFFLTNLINKADTYLFWKKFSQHIVKYPKTYFSLSLVILLSLSYPVISIELWEPLQTLTPHGSESRNGYEVLEKDGWGGELIPINVIVKAPNNSSLLTKEGISFIYDFTKSIENHPKVNSVQSITSWNNQFGKDEYFNFYSSFYSFSFFLQDNPVSKLINTTGKSNLTLINIYLKDLMNIHDAYEIINYTREYAKNHKQFEILTGGNIARSRDFTKELYGYVPQMLLIICGGIYLLLFFSMRSLVLPLKAAIMNFLPILGSFGILVIVFQYGYFGSIFNTPFNKAVASMVPVVLFCVVFGLSMDYEVLILSRITEFYRKTGDVNTAVVEGLARSGSVITGAALILLGVFMPGIFSSSPLVKEICIGITGAIFLDATIVRLFLVPSFMLLMGKWNWWNPFLKK